MPDKNTSASAGQAAEKVHIVVSYRRSSDDEYIKDKLLAYIRSEVEHAGAELWVDRDISPGDDWKETIHQVFEQADIAIILVSQEYLASDDAMEIEAKILVERRERGKLVLLPVMLSACNWEACAWLSTTRLFPSDNQTIMEHYQEIGLRNRLFHTFLTFLLKRIEEVKMRRASEQTIIVNKPAIQLPSLLPQSALTTEPRLSVLPQLTEKRVLPARTEPQQPKQPRQFRPERAPLSEPALTRTYTFQIISTSTPGGAMLIPLLRKPIVTSDGQTVLFKPTRERPVHVFFVLEEGRVPAYSELRAYLAQGSRPWFIVLTQDRAISPHTLEEKAELLRAEIYARTKIFLQDIYVCSLPLETQGSRSIAKLLQALVQTAEPAS